MQASEEVWARILPKVDDDLDEKKEEEGGSYDVLYMFTLFNLLILLILM